MNERQKAKMQAMSREELQEVLETALELVNSLLEILDEMGINVSLEDEKGRAIDVSEAVDLVAREDCPPQDPPTVEPKLPKWLEGLVPRKPQVIQ